MSQPGAATASGPKATPSDLPAGAELRDIRITPSENGGFTVSCSYDAPRTRARKGDFACSTYIEPKNYTFESKASMLAYVGKLF